jgi:glycine cleavage system H protein
MSQIPENLLYTRDHEWIQPNEDGTALIGVTDYAQQSLGDVTFVELPAVGSILEQGAAFGVVESVKAASDLYMPVAGEILEINSTLENEPQWVNTEPYTKAWMLRIKMSKPEQTSALLKPSDYAALI